jgi:hypothetical protein
MLQNSEAGVMAPNHDTQVISIESIEPARQGLASLISTAVVLSVGISIATAAMLLAAAMWLEQ